MCGIAGYFGSIDDDRDCAGDIVDRMADAIATRGPDARGVWMDPEACVALAHRRLAILDLSPNGAQPMLSASGRYVLSFNGEIYNHLELRRQLERFPSPQSSAARAAPSPTPQGHPLPQAGKGTGERWRGHSDTESLLAGFDAWGIEATIKKSLGMFAFAVWDKATRTLTLGRDRIGEKPLYYGWQGRGGERVFLFGSELKALKAHPAFAAEIDRGALTLFMRHSYVPAPYSIYQGISKVMPGCLLTVSLAQPEPSIQAYWRLANVAQAGIAQPFAGSPEEAVLELENLATHAIAQQMVADVPLGAFLSGGVDSSTVVALMQAQSSRPVKTFTIGFQEEGYNEAGHAKLVAGHLGTDHTELYVSPQHAMEVIPKLAKLYCEPFADSSQIPTYLVSQMTRQHVTVSLSGDAGDELFAGYNRYQVTAQHWRSIKMVPSPLRALAVRILQAVSPAGWNAAARFIPGSARFANFGDKLHKGAAVLDSGSVDELYLHLVSQHTHPADWVIGGHEPPTQLTGLRPSLEGLDGVEGMMALDALTYLPDDILVKVDRAAMAVSLETRVPFLDHRLIEFAWSLPLNYKLRDGVTKWPLRQVLYRHVPKKLIERPKMGFGIPLHDWLRGPLRAWAEDLLAEPRLRSEGFFNPLPVRKMWAEHLEGGRNWAHPLWCVLAFQQWLEAQKAA